ncbi:MAG: ABC transporter substrate-binding protein [Burkholderiales bacterium]|nr:ABC transporter substrate-binding protein [Burkholderiales bacterium]
MKRAILSFVLLVFLGGTAVMAQADIPPDVLAKTTTEEVLEILRTNKDIRSDPKKVTELVEAKVLPNFDFNKMTRLAVGKGWRQATPEQRETLVTEFRNLLVRTYGSSLTQYKNETIEFKPFKMDPSATDVTVKSQINRAGGGQPVAVDYSMEKTANGWKVYDVTVEAVSLVTTYRGSFADEVQRTGIDGLIASLQQKNRDATAGGAASGR